MSSTAYPNMRSKPVEPYKPKQKIKVYKLEYLYRVPEILKHIKRESWEIEALIFEAKSKAIAQWAHKYRNKYDWDSIKYDEILVEESSLNTEIWELSFPLKHGFTIDNKRYNDEFSKYRIQLDQYKNKLSEWEKHNKTN